MSTLFSQNTAVAGASTGLFGSKPTTGTGGLFGNISTPQQSTNPMNMGNPSPSPSLFSNNPIQPSTNPATSSIFGGSSGPSLTSSGNPFQNNNNQTPQKTGLFNQPTATTSTGLFGSIGPNTQIKPASTGSTGLFGNITGGITPTTGLIFNTNANQNLPQNQGILFGGNSLNMPNAPDGFFKSSLLPQDVLSL